MVSTGRRGAPPTLDEQQLLEQLDEAAPVPEATARWLALAKRVGLQALTVLLDEFAGEKVHIPQRGVFFASLKRQRRLQEIQRMHAEGKSVPEIATALSLDRRRVWEALSGCADDARRES